MAQAVHDETPAATHEPGADAHHGHHDDPNAAPMHHDIKSDFSTGSVVIITLLGIIATVAGLVGGLVFVND